MPLDLTAIRQAVAARIKAGIDRDINGYGGYVPTSPTAPCFIIKPADNYLELDAGFCPDPAVTVNFEIWYLTTPGTTDGQRLLDQLLSIGGTNSVYTALAEDPYLPNGLGRIVVGNSRYRDRMLWGAPDSQTIFDWAMTELAVKRGSN